jgi:hypothetical protein
MGRYNGLHRTLLPLLCVFLLLDLRGGVVILAFCLGLYIGPYRVGALCHFPSSFFNSLVRSEPCLDFNSNQKRKGDGDLRNPVVKLVELQ